MTSPYKLDSKHDHAAANILHYFFLKGIAEDKSRYFEQEIFSVVSRVQETRDANGAELFDLGSGYAEDRGGLGVWCQAAADHLAFLRGMEWGFNYEHDDFFLRKEGYPEVAGSAARFAMENPPAARELAKALGTNLETILLTAVKIIVPEDPYEKPKNISSSQ